MKSKRYRLTQRGRQLLIIVVCTIIMITVCLIAPQFSSTPKSMQKSNAAFKPFSLSSQSSTTPWYNFHISIGPVPLNAYAIEQEQLELSDESENTTFQSNVNEISTSNGSEDLETSERIIEDEDYSKEILVEDESETESIENSISETTASIVEETIIEETVTEEIIAEETIAEETIPEDTTSSSTSTEDVVIEDTSISEWTGPILTKQAGVIQGPSGKESFYNLDMSNILDEMINKLGYDYEYWVREDGVKMFGPYVMCAANLNIRPKGTIIQTSLGMAIVCDTGGFAVTEPYQLDIAVTW